MSSTLKRPIQSTKRTHKKRKLQKRKLQKRKKPKEKLKTIISLPRRQKTVQLELNDIIANLTNPDPEAPPKKVTEQIIRNYLEKKGYKPGPRLNKSELWEKICKFRFPKLSHIEKYNLENAQNRGKKAKQKLENIRSKAHNNFLKAQNKKETMVSLEAKTAKKAKKAKKAKTSKKAKKAKKAKTNNPKKIMRGGEGTRHTPPNIKLYCDPPLNGIYLTNLTGTNIYGMARPIGADIDEDIKYGDCADIGDCRIKLYMNMDGIYNIGIRGYINLENPEERLTTTDFEKNIWENLKPEKNTTYENPKTTDMEEISIENLGKIDIYYEANKDSPIVVHCLCGKGRTGNAILFLLFNNIDTYVYNPQEVFSYAIHRGYINDNFAVNTSKEVFRYESYPGSVSNDNFEINLFLTRLNNINEYIGHKNKQPFRIYKLFNNTDEWDTIDSWLIDNNDLAIICASPNCEMMIKEPNYKTKTVNEKTYYFCENCEEECEICTRPNCEKIVEEGEYEADDEGKIVCIEC